jgi:urease accessory protein
MTNAHRSHPHLPACLLLLLLPAVALAHPGDDLTTSVAAGLLHPLTGLDHLLAMIATGIWAAHLSRRASISLPMIFAAAMLVGGALVAFGVGLPGIEPMIALSVAVLGLLIAAGVRVNEIVGAGLIATFAIFHGYAHASEATAMQVPFALGFVFATLCLNFAGVWVGTHLRTGNSNVVRIAGSLIGAGGAMLLLAA